MTRAARYLGALVAVLAVALAGMPVRAMESGPLPAFEVTALDGVRVSSAGLARQGRWLLVYVQPGCVPCEGVLNLLKEDGAGGLPENVTVVASGTAEETRALAGLFPNLTRSAWYADPLGAARDRLGLQGVPMVLAMQGSTIEWSIAGLLPDTASLQALFRAWAAGGSPSQ